MGTEGMQRTCVWGHCQGSGKNPYQTVIDLNDIAFKCSCPSRKFPCKHGLGLLLLYARQPDQFTQAEEPEWVTAWLAKRTEKAEKKEQKAKSETPVMKRLRPRGRRSGTRRYWEAYPTLRYG